MEVEDLNTYAFDALLTWGDVNTFKHLLPRIFELYLNNPEAEVWCLDPEIPFKKFSHGHWDKWPTNEQIAIRILLHSVCAQAIAEQPEARFMNPENWLCAIALAEDDLSSYLAQRLDNESEQGSESLASFMKTTDFAIIDGRGPTAFWEERSDHSLQVAQWIKSERVVLRFQHLLTEKHPAPNAATFTAVLQMIQ